MIIKLKEILGSITKALDLIYVIEDTKPCARLIIRKENNRLLEFLNEKKLKYKISDFKILKHTDKTRNFSDKGIIIDKDDNRDGDFFIYISKDKNIAKRAKEMEEKQKHKELGLLLGYPDCCSEFFERHNEEASRTTNDFTIYTFKESENIKFPWQNNYCLRSFDISLLSHFPCNFNCEKSKKIAENNLKIIRKYDSDIANYYSAMLKCAVIYSEGIGVYSLNRFSISKENIIYSPTHIVASANNEFYEILKNKNNIKVYSKNKFTVGNTLIQDERTFLGLFS
jgi:hypothetical protein